MNTVLLRSAGIDSHCISCLTKPEKEVYFLLGGQLMYNEIRCLPAHVIQSNIFDIDRFTLSNAILPRRNAFLVLGAAFYGDLIYLGTTAGDTTRDKDPEFIARMNSLLYWMGNDPGKATNARVTAPFADYTKTELVKLYLSQGGSETSLAYNTWSCYEPSKHNLECGKCRSCLRKYVALTLNDVPVAKTIHDPVKHLPEALEYAKKRRRGAEVNEIQRCLDRSRK